MDRADSALWALFEVIVAGDIAGVSRLLSAAPELARATIETGASRQTGQAFLLGRINRYIYSGETALHIAAAAYDVEIARKLLAAGADIRARNRRGQEALHAAAAGNPDSAGFDPAAQEATIIFLIEAGADPNGMDKSGVSPLHKAIRTRCAAAVRALLAHGADPERPNKNGSTPMLLATLNTGRGGSGSAGAKRQQQEILLMLERAVAGV
jgi:ankyrin repeat protein